jgi:hypothetical protein
VRKLAAKLSRSVAANALGLCGASVLVDAAWQWDTTAGLAALGVLLVVIGWAVDA